MRRESPMAVLTGRGHTEHGPHSDLYREFVDFVGVDIQKERKLANQRLFSVFLWSFIAPTVVAATLIIFVKMGWLPRSFNRYLDLIIVFFPAAYGLYMLSFDAFRELPTAIKRGGVVAALNRSLHEERWRARVCREMKTRFLHSDLECSREGWSWVISNFRIDLKHMQDRTKYLTAIAGAVIFLIFDGIDALDVGHREPVWSATTIMSWFESSSSHFAQLVSLGIFLMLLYVSGNQIYLSLSRYLECAILALDEKSPRSTDEV